jgi:beta-galactosidase/beta-glucuronidase
MNNLLIDDLHRRLADGSRDRFSKDEPLVAFLRDIDRSVELVRPEYPRPQFVRGDHWLNLNGLWEFEFDYSRSGQERGVQSQLKLSSQILVPYAPESKLSGIGHTDFIPAVWYRRTINVPQNWIGQRLLLHLGACDYKTWVYIDGQEVGSHAGGFTSFGFDITSAVAGRSEFSVSIYAEDDVRSGVNAKGKQAHKFHSHDCHYTRTTGLWQTVWLEAVPQTYLASAKATPDLASGALQVEVRFGGALPRDGEKVRLTAKADGKVVGEAVFNVTGSQGNGTVAVSTVRAWTIADPFLYDLTYELLGESGKTLDIVHSYFGLRSVAIEKNYVAINGEPVFQRLILDQGFYPDGIFTAPSDAALRRDIELSQDAGFNGARLHQKVFEPRFLYWCDRLGYIVYGETPDWGLDVNNAQALAAFTINWVEELERDYNHPAIVGWCPFNEKTPTPNPDSFRAIYRMAKAYDASRPVIDVSGWSHVVTDIYDVHDYEQDPDRFAANYKSLAEGNTADVFMNDTIYLSGKFVLGQPYFVSEYGGIQWSPKSTREQAWGYGNAPKTEEEYKARYKSLTETLLFNPNVCAFCYTQLTDVEQEVNGVYYYDRAQKFDPAFFKKINTQTAAIERKK